MSMGKRVATVTTPVPRMPTMPFPTAVGDLPRDQFGELFCSVFSRFCGRYISPVSALTPLANAVSGAEKYRFVVVPGILGHCIEATASLFKDAGRW
jgi:hypothetical protein